MALTRNESAVHEKIGVYDKVVTGEHNAMVLGEHIDLRIFPKVWAHGFAVEKRDGDDISRSLQFFDAAGEAVHKVHLRAGVQSRRLSEAGRALASADQSPDGRRLQARRRRRPSRAARPRSVDDLRERWSRMTDVHQFFGMLRALKLDAAAGRAAWSATTMPGCSTPTRSPRCSTMPSPDELPIMCFVGNRGCIQIHSGPIKTVKPMGPWINVLDETFHLHLRLDHVRELWAVRKPTKDGHVTSLEAYDARRRDDHPVLRQAPGRPGRARRLAVPCREPAAHPASTAA